MNALADDALAYGAHGWPVFPLKPRDKVPLIPKRDGGRGCHDATAAPDRITACWSRWPNANIGVAAGEFWILDVDYGGWNATAPDGLDSLRAIQERFGKLPPTVTQITGSGGFQFFWQPDARVKNGVKFLPGLDTRSIGGYAVVPPSVHPCGVAYRWRRGHGPDEIEIPTAPQWLIALVEPVELPQPGRTAPTKVTDLDRYAGAALTRAADTIQRAPFGSQNDVLDRQAYGIGRLVAGGVVPAGTAREALVRAGCRMANAPRRRPWTEAEIAWRVDRAFAQAAHAPRTPEPRQ